MAEEKSKKDTKDKHAPNAAFRVMYNTHLSLLQMADRKAHFLIALNLGLLSMVASRKDVGLLAAHQHFLIPNICLGVFCLTCITLAILSTRPKLAGTPDPDKPGFNWLFFGHYSGIPLERFQKSIHDLSGDKKAVHTLLSSDIYWMGVVLKRKYQYLTICYWVFGIGLPVLIVIYASFWYAR
jgi:hypothetical protein